MLYSVVISSQILSFSVLTQK